MHIDWNEAVAEIGPALYRYFCASFTTSVADDLVQTTIIRLIEKVRDGSFAPERGSLRVYAFGIAHFVRLEALRTTRAHDEIEEGELVALDAGVEVRLAEAEDLARLRDALSLLTEVQRQIVSLRIDEELHSRKSARSWDCP